MPADNQYDVVHDLTKGGLYYGCHSKPRKHHGYIAPDRVYSGMTFRNSYTFIKNEMSNKCRNFYLWDLDPKCDGCTVERDVDYMERMKEME